MPNYDEIIQQSQVNVNALAQKLRELDQLHIDIKKLIKHPETFDAKFVEVRELAESYTKSIGSSVKIFLDGNNTLFIAKLKEMEEKIGELDTQISRLTNTNYEELFKSLQLVFIEQTRKDLELELKKVDEKTILIQERIDEFRAQIERLEKIDLEKYFDSLQKTLSEIFGAVNSINITLTKITQTLSTISESISSLKNSVELNQKELVQLNGYLLDTINQKFIQNEKQAKHNFEIIESKLNSLKDQNLILQKDVKMNRIIQIIAFSILGVLILFCSAIIILF
jgi:predicted  nucleic acid-binding Zn-ribbon protein